MYADGFTGGGEWLPELDVRAPERQRRLTVFFRWLLLIPHYIVLWLLGIAAFFVAILGWFAALVTGRLPDFAANYLSDVVRYSTRIHASHTLLVDTYPPFAFYAPDYPVQIELRPGELNRLAVLLRIFLVIPAAIVVLVVGAGWHVCAFFIWLFVLVLGRTPEPAFGANAAMLRFSMRTQAYFLMLTSSYPKRLFGDGALESVSPGRPPLGTRPLLLSSGARVLLIVFIIIGIADVATGGSAPDWTSSDHAVVRA